MSLSADRSQMLNCPRCGNHCPVSALKCGKGRKYFGVENEVSVDRREHKHDCEHKHEHECRQDHEHKHKHEHKHGHKHDHPQGELSCLLHRCGRFVRHAGLEEDELFQALTDEERVALKAALEKLSAGWQAQYGEEALDGHGKKHRKHHD